MGTVVEAKNLQTGKELFRLLIYAKASGPLNDIACSVNKPLAEELLKLKPSRRTMQMEKCFVRVLATFPQMPVIKDIDVMFNPAYEVDVMKMLISAYKQKPFKLVWPGNYEDGRLIYSYENYQDYRTFEINDYDIICVI